MDSKSSPQQPHRFTRRQALKSGAAAVAAATIWRVRPTSAAALKDQVRVAAVGVGNRGWADLQAVASAPGARIVALCDVDSNFLDKATSAFDKANAFRDYRKMLTIAATKSTRC
jgi:hypothetical protein